MARNHTRFNVEFIPSGLNALEYPGAAKRGGVVLRLMGTLREWMDANAPAAKARLHREARCSYRSIDLALAGRLRSVDTARRIALVAGCAEAELMGLAGSGDGDGAR